MNIHKIKYFVLAFCIAVLAGCGTSDPNIEEARLNLGLTNYEGVMEAAQEAINENPENGDGYYYMGIGITQKALQMHPSERTSQYAEAKEYFDQAKELYAAQEVSSDETETLPDYILELWSQEHNLGIGLISENFEQTEEDSLVLAEHHLNSAVTINPDSSLSYGILYEVNYLLDDIDEAIANAEKLIYELGSDDLYNYYRLSYFYQEQDDYDKALELLDMALENNPENIEIIQELANLYLTIGDTDKALETVQSLIDADPENPQYRLVYGTQVYQLVMNMDDQMTEYYDEVFDINQELRTENRRTSPDTQKVQELEQRLNELNSQIDELQAEIDEFSNRAEEELKVAVELDPDNPVGYSTLGIIYQNRAAAVFERRNATEDYELAEQLDEEARELLHVAIPYYQKATELDPDDPENWRSLFRIYTTLGMNEEAEAAQEKAGF
ncbi:MAG: tetratricopeptide repeat protein [Balneolales bacterium]